MMKLVMPFEINGSVLSPPSKSQSIRVFVASLLTRGESLILDPSFCDDAQAALGAIRSLGAETKRVNSSSSSSLKIKGGFPERNLLPTAGATICCGESALTLRLLASIVALQDKPVCLQAQGSLKRRPMDMIEAALKKLGVTCSTQSGLPPVWIKGPLKPGLITLDASRTSQFLSGLLFALPLLSGDSEIRAFNLKSKPYVELTLETLNHFGLKFSVEREAENYRFQVKGNQQYCPREIKIEGDWSGAAYFIVAAALNGRIEILGLNPHSKQADRKILEVLRKAGGNFTWQGEKLVVEKSKLYGFHFEAEDCPDLFPPLSILALGCQGKSTIYGVSRLQIKESDRASALVKELSSCGARIYRQGDALVIEGRKLKGGIFNSWGDHRLAMAGAVAGLISPQGIMIQASEAVKKSFPDFFDQLKACGGKIK